MQRLKPIAEREYLQCNPLNRELVEEYLSNSSELSDKTLYAYKSNLRIWLVWIKDNLKNKNVTEIKPREYLKFQNWLVSLGHSSSDINTKRATVSSFCNYIEVFYLDEYPNYRKCINSGIGRIENSYVNEKNPPTREEIEMMCQKLEESNYWNKYELIAYLKFTFETGCRRGETIQLKKSLINAEPVVKEITIKDENGQLTKRVSRFYCTPKIRCKGKGKAGKIRQLKFSDYSMQWIKKWIEVRGEDDIDALFIAKNPNLHAIGSWTVNEWATDIFTPLLGRRFHPHALREAIATDIVVEQGKSVEAAKALLGHASSQVTLQHYVIGLDQESESDELFIE